MEPNVRKFVDFLRIGIEVSVRQVNPKEVLRLNPCGRGACALHTQRLQLHRTPDLAPVITSAYAGELPSAPDEVPGALRERPF